MSSTFSASEAIDLLIRLGWSSNGVAEWTRGALVELMEGSLTCALCIWVCGGIWAYGDTGRS